MAVAAALLVVPVLGACSAGTDGDAETQSSTEGGGDVDVAATAPAADQRARKAPPVGQRAVISTGTVSLRAEDVGAARFDVQKVIDEQGGQIGEEDTETDRSGEVRRSRLVVRVPVERFDDTMAALSAVAELSRATRASEDVTTQVIDTEARLRAQAASLRRVEALLAEASTLKDVVSIEAQLTRRQADLESLRSQHAWLKDQTSLSTITVHLERTGAAQEDDPEEAGFLAGLSAGWGALLAVATGAATALGATLPFAVVLLVLGLPAWLLLRRRRAPGEPDTTAADSA